MRRGRRPVAPVRGPFWARGGERHDQRPGAAAIAEEECPAAARLLDLVVLPVIDVSLANLAQAQGAGSNEAVLGLADEWIEDDRALVDAWIAEAITAG